MTRKTIASIAAETAATLRETAPRARERTLDAADIEAAIRQHLKAARREPTGNTVTTTARGGYVPNGYKYRADCDVVDITGRRVGDLQVSAGRGWAQKRAYGAGDTVITRSRKPEQTQGRIVARS